MTSEAAEDQGWKREPRVESEAERLSRNAPRFCDLCEAFGDHHTDRHPAEDDEPIADSEFVADLLAQCRETQRKAGGL